MYNSDFDILEAMVKLGDACHYYAAIGDVHSDLAGLNRAVADIEAWRKRRKVPKRDLTIVLMGDLIDGSGGDPRGVLTRAGELVSAGAVLLQGNHDRFITGTADMTTTTFDDGRERYNSWLWGLNGGLANCIRLYGFPPENVEPIRMYDQQGRDISGSDVNVYRDIIKTSAEYAMIKSAPVKLETDSIFFCHAPQSKKYKGGAPDDILVWGHKTDYSHPKGDAVFIVPNDKSMSVHGHFHWIDRGFNFPRVHHYVHAGSKPKTVVLCDSGGGRGGRIHPVIVKEYAVGGKHPEIETIL